MLRVALKGLKGHKLRFALTTFSVVMGVMFLAGSFVFTDSIQRAFDGLFDDAFAEADVFVNAVSDRAGQAGGIDVTTLPQELTDEVAAVEGVARAAGYVDGTAIILDADGEAVNVLGAPALAESFDPLSPVDIAVGTEPSGPDEVAIDRASAETLGAEVGDAVDLFVGDERRTFTLVGITSFGTTDNLLGASIASFDLSTAQELLGKTGRYDGIGVVVEEGADAEAVRDAIEAAVGTDDLEVVTSEQEAESAKAEIAEGLGFLTRALLVFAGVSVFVAAFIIANTFSIVVAQRSREFALLRALGASTRQVRWAVISEAVVVGLVASAIGVAFGVGAAIGIREALDAAGFSLPDGGVVVQLRTIVASFIVGVGVTLASALGAARRASRVSPIEAMQEARTAGEKGLGLRVALGGVVTALGVALLAFGLVWAESGQLQLVGGGAAATLLGVALLAPLFAGPVAALLGGLAARAGVAGRLAKRNAARDRRRTAATASALMIGLSLVTLVTVLTATVQGAVADTIDEQFRADFVVQSTDFTGPGLPVSLVDRLRARDEIGAVTASTYTVAEVGDDPSASVSIVDVPDAGSLIASEWSAGAVEALVDGAVVVSEERLETLGVAVGDEVELTFVSGETRTLTVGGSFTEADNPLVGAPIVLGRGTVPADVTGGGTPVLFASAADDIDAARVALEEVAADVPLLTLQDQAEFREQQQGQIDGLLNLFIGLLGLALFIALLGIANTLALAVFERTREIGLLRAVGLDRGQAGRMVVLEAVIVSVFGALLGLAVGTGFAVALVQALSAEAGGLSVVLPAGRLAIYLVAAALAGAGAAVFPAWRAARLDVLRAVTTE